MRARAEVDAAAAVPLFGMGARRARAELAAAFDALVASLSKADQFLIRRPAGLAEMDRSIARLYEVIFIRQGSGGPSVLNLLEQHETRLELLEELVAELRRRLDAVEPGPRPLARAAGGGR